MKDNNKGEKHFCEYCRKEIESESDYLIIKDFIEGKENLTNYFHRICFKENLDNNYVKKPAVKLLKHAFDMAKTAQGRLNTMEASSHG